MDARKTKRRIIALAFLVGFLGLSILSGTFLLAHAVHEHDQNGVHGSCAVCVQLQSAENTLKQFGMAISGMLFSITGFYAVVKSLREIFVFLSFSTPVALKIRMNN